MNTQKVPKVLEKYDLTDLELEESYLGTGTTESIGVRPLSEELNIEILRSALEDNQGRYLEGEIEQFYYALTERDEGDEYRHQIEAQLREEGVDVSTLREDFVSYGALYRYLREKTGLKKKEQSDRSLEDFSETIEKTRHQARRSIRSQLSDAAETTPLSLGEIDVYIQTQVYCEDCDRQFTVQEILDKGGCDCQNSD